MDLFTEYIEHIGKTDGDPIQLDFLHNYLAGLPEQERAIILALSLEEWNKLIAIK